MKIFTFSIFLFLLTSCARVKITPIKESYAKRPFVITSTSNFATVWDKLIDLFAQNGLPIKIIDRSSGLIISDRSILTSTFELKDGGLKNPKAFLVLPKLYDPTTQKTSTIARDSQVTGEWNVRLKEVDGQTLINVNIVNVKYDTWDAAARRSREIVSNDYQSTGVFETMISDTVK